MLAWGRILLLALASAAILAGCGSDDGSIPQEDGDRLLLRLHEVERAVPRGECEGALGSANLLVEQVNQLPGDVDSDVREALDLGARRLVELTSEQCEPAEEPEPGPVAPPPPPTAPPEEEEPEDEEEVERPDDDEDPGPGNRGRGSGGEPGGGPPSGGADGGTRADG